MLYFFIGLAVWYVVGFASFVYWWTTEYDFTYSELVTASLVAVLGPITWLCGQHIHGEPRPLIKKREKESGER